MTSIYILLAALVFAATAEANMLKDPNQENMLITVQPFGIRPAVIVCYGNQTTRRYRKADVESGRLIRPVDPAVESAVAFGYLTAAIVAIRVQNQNLEIPTRIILRIKGGKGSIE